jgi:two-component system chemotaxis sensor kinase CheA
MISGRGVGLDIVKRNLEKISASVEVSSTPGYGTRFKIVTNRALVTVSALVVEVHNIRFAVMHGDLVKVMLIEEKDLNTLVKFEGGRFMRTNEGLMALIELRQILGLPPRKLEPDESRDLMVIMVSNGEQRFGLVVDDAHDSEEIIVKPLGSYLTRMDHYKGVAILQDGGLVLILNIAPMLRLVDFESLEGVINLDTKRQATISEFEKVGNMDEEVVLCRVVPRGLLAVRLEEVVRLEELDPAKIEAEGEAESTQYWGEVLRLIPVQRMLVPTLAKEEFWRSKQAVPIIVVERDGGLFGLVVTEVLDIVKVRLKFVREDVRPGLFGTILVDGKIVELVDSQALIELFENRSDGKVQPSNI